MVGPASFPRQCGLCDQPVLYVEVLGNGGNGYPAMQIIDVQDGTLHADTCDANPFAADIPDGARIALGRSAVIPGGDAA